MAASRGLHSRQTGEFNLDETVPSDLPDPLMSSSPVRPLAAISDATEVDSITATAEANFWDGLPDVIAGSDAPVAVGSSVAPACEDVQPTSTTAEVQLENGKS